MEDIFNKLEEKILVIDIKGKILFANKSFLLTLQYENSDIIDKHMKNILFPYNYYSPDMFDNTECYLNGTITLSFSSKLGNKLIGVGEIIKNEWKSEQAGIIIFKELKEQKNIDEKANARIISYEDALMHESIKNQFFTNVSHEFKTPLNIILTTMQLVNRDIRECAIQSTNQVNLIKYMSSIKQNSYRLLRLVNNIIDISRIDAGYYNLNLENHNIINIIEEITMSVVQYVENKGINIVFDTEIEEEIIACDPEKIERVMLNILSNAIKYTDDGGEIKVNISVVNNKVIISVKDTGIGIPKEKLGSIFNRFVQANNTLIKKYDGSGIGLFLVKLFVELHKGEIKVKSEVGQGTEFIIQIPITKVEVNEKRKEEVNDLSLRVEKCNVEFSDIYNIFSL